MRLKIYRAASMTHAMAQLRAELGPDALILGARTLREGVELTAAADPATETSAPPLAPPPPPSSRPLPWRPPAQSGLATASRLQALAAHHALPAALLARLPAAPLPEALAATLRFAPIAANLSPLLFAGPPGAGKTSTVARLATRLVLAGAQVMVITADGRRAGATEQLAAYTRLLGLNLVVATHPDTLRRALTRRPEGAAVLIDAPGCDIHDTIQLQELLALAEAADSRIAAVLPAGLDAAEGADIATALAGLGAELLVATRLDLARRLGSLIAAADAAGLAFCEAGIGPGAADGLLTFTPALLAERLNQGLPARAAAPDKATA
jgi:flagellar biosynthesis protein FlhF